MTGNSPCGSRRRKRRALESDGCLWATNYCKERSRGQDRLGQYRGVPSIHRAVALNGLPAKKPQENKQVPRLQRCTLDKWTPDSALLNSTLLPLKRGSAHSFSDDHLSASPD